MELMIFDPAKKRMVRTGDIIEDAKGKHFYRLVMPDHYYNKLDAYGIQATVIDELTTREISVILLHEADTDKLHYSLTKTWLEKGILRDEMHGKQIFLPVKFMKDTQDELVNQESLF